MAKAPTIKVRLEVEPGMSWPEDELYCPCALTCHKDRHPCSFGCVAHDYDALRRIVRAENTSSTNVGAGTPSSVTPSDESSGTASEPAPTTTSHGERP
jgi:hypothetical protein